MSQKIKNDDGTEVEVYTAEEVQAQVATAVTAKETEFGKTKIQLESERDDARKALGDRAGEFKNFRELHADVVAKLDVAQRTIYENQKAAHDAEVKRDEDAKAAHAKSVDAAIRAKAGTDEALFKKIKDTYSVIGIADGTPQEMEQRLGMAIGAIRSTEPDLVAALGDISGAHMPPEQKRDNDKSFADTEQGKAAAKEFGFITEAPAAK